MAAKTAKASKALKIKRDDTVVVIAGKDKGKRGRVTQSIPAKNRIVVEKVNLVRHAMRPTQQNPQGGISSIEAALDASNVAIVCPKCNETTRIGYRFDDSGKKIRVCKKCGRDID